VDCKIGERMKGRRLALIAPIPLATRAARALVVASVACASCGGPTVPRPPMVQQPTSALFEVPYPPPPARVEIVPGQPHPAAVWIDGEWVWRGRRWGWGRGRWVIPPPRARFSPWTSVRNAEGVLLMAQGTWRDANGAEIEPPPALAVGQSSTGAVVTPEGEVQEVGPNADDERRRRTRATPVSPIPEPPHAMPPGAPFPDAGVGTPPTTGTPTTPPHDAGM